MQPARTGRPFARSRIAMQEQRPPPPSPPRGSRAAPAHGAARRRVVEVVAGDDRADVVRQARWPSPPRRAPARRRSRPSGRSPRRRRGRSRRPCSAAAARAITASPIAVPGEAAGRADADERRHAEHQQLLDDDRGRRRAHHRRLDGHRDAVDRARVAEQPAVLGHEPARLEPAVEAGRDLASPGSGRPGGGRPARSRRARRAGGSGASGSSSGGGWAMRVDQGAVGVVGERVAARRWPARRPSCPARPRRRGRRCATARRGTRR